MSKECTTSECLIPGFLGIFTVKKYRNIIHPINRSKVRNHEDVYTCWDSI